MVSKQPRPNLPPARQSLSLSSGSGAGAGSGSGPPRATAEQISASLKGVLSEQLSSLLIYSLGYERSPFNTKRAHRLKEFALNILTGMEMRWNDFVALKKERQEALLAVCAFPPPHGAVDFFVSVWECVSVFLLCQMRSRCSSLQATQGETEETTTSVESQSKSGKEAKEESGKAEKADQLKKMDESDDSGKKPVAVFCV